MLIAMALSRSRPVKSTLVNWLPRPPPGQALVGVEDFRPAVLRHRLFDGLEAELDLHRDRHPPSQNPAAEPVDHRRQVNKASRHRDIEPAPAKAGVMSIAHTPAFAGAGSGWADRPPAHATGTDRSCDPVPASTCSAGDRAPRCPCVSSSSRPA